MEDQEERQRRVDEGRALFGAYQASVEQLAISMQAVAERLERQNQLLTMIVQQNNQGLESNRVLCEHMQSLQRQIAANVQVQAQGMGLPVQQHGYGPSAAQNDVLGQALNAIGQNLFRR